jgi:flagellar hook-associated protein 1
MSLFGSIQMAGNTLQAMQIGLHVVGNNIANANTPGYIRERTIYTPAPVMKLGNLTLGLGVEVAGIVQSLDKFAEDRLRGATGDRAGAEIQEKTYGDIEAILGELGDTDVSTSLTSFFNRINEILDQPSDVSLRDLAIGAGKTLTDTINNLHRRVETLHTDFGREVQNYSSEINSLTSQIGKLNLQIVSLEGSASSNQAGGLRSQRHEALKRLAEIADINATETATGAVNVTIHGDVLVSEGTAREVKTVFSTANGLPTAAIHFAEGGSPLDVRGGALHGIYQARDAIAGGFLERLDEFAGALVFEFNKVYSQGQGITGFSSTTSQNSVSNSTAQLDEAGLDFTPVSGEFNLLVHNKTTGLTSTHRIGIDLNGLDGDTSLATLAADINAVGGVTAHVTSDNRLEIRSDSNELQIAFEDDTSGALAALGINTFFTGGAAGELGINPGLLADGSKFAAGHEGKLGVDVTNAQRLIALHDQGIDGLGGASITGFYDRLVNELAQGSAAAASVADGFRVFEDTLTAAAQSVSGVNLDEEAIDMLMLQQTYQASARYISTLSDLMDVLLTL